MINQLDGETLPISTILESLRNSEQVSIHLLYRLSDMSPEELVDFYSIWDTIDEDKRRIIIRHLADITEHNFQVDFSDVFAHGLDDKAAEVRLASLDGLWDCERISLIEKIIELMRDDPSVEVRALAAATLGHYVLLAEWGQIPLHHAEPIADALLEQIDDYNADAAIQRAALESISASGHPRVQSLIQDAYISGELDSQISALFAMGRSADPYWLNILREEMSSPVVEMRIEAARAVGEIAHTSAVPELIELTSDEDLEVRLMAITSLGRIGGDVAHRYLSELAEDPDHLELHETVVEALDEIEWLGGAIDLLPGE